MLNDYKSWLKENDKLINSLKGSIILDRFSDMFTVLNFLSKRENELDSDLSVIYDSGFAYLFDRLGYIEEFLDEDFSGDINELLKYDLLINYYIYIEDLVDVLLDKEADMSIYQPRLDEISNDIENIISNKLEFDDEKIEKYNMLIDGALPSKDDLWTVPEIFSRILDELILEENKAGRQFKI